MAVYEVKPETGNGRSRVLHRNMLLHVRTYPLRHTLSHPRVAVQCLGKLTGSNLYKRKQPDPHMGALLTSHLINFTNFAELFRIWLSGMWELNGILLGLMNRIPSGEW